VESDRSTHERHDTQEVSASRVLHRQLSTVVTNHEDSQDAAKD
jgi:hypothetical protein